MPIARAAFGSIPSTLRSWKTCFAQATSRPWQTLMATHVSAAVFGSISRAAYRAG